MKKIVKAFFFFIFLCWTYAFIDITFFSPNCNEFAVLGGITASKPVAALSYFLLAMLALVSIRATNTDEKRRN